MNAQAVQQAIRFLAELSATASATGGTQPDALKAAFDEQSLVRYAATLGYELDPASIAEAFRLQMLARELQRRKRSTQSLQSP